MALRTCLKVGKIFGNVCWTERRPISQRYFRLVWNLLILPLSYSGANFIKIKATLVNWPQPTALKNETKGCTLQISNFSNMGSLFQRKCPLVFPLMSYDCSACLQPFILAELSPTTTSCSFTRAGSLHVAFRNLRESHSWGRAVVGHQRENQRIFSP